ncbi:MAG: hypothetical protein KC729_03155, partial [Candidatus Eisenbacteria bacterium]|nr:hypothetical protein [Candidatus Eisenbacteria bacterium]
SDPYPHDRKPAPRRSEDQHASGASRRRLLHSARNLLALVAILFVGLACASSKPGDGTPAPGSVALKLGADGAEASSPDLTLDALRAGQAVYMVEGAHGAMYTLQLTEEQIADLIAGSTVMTEASGERGTEPVQISVQKAKKKSFLGW